MTIQKKFADKVYDLRKERKMTQEQVAEACKISVRHYQDVEAGRVNPRMDTVFQLASVLEISLDELAKAFEEERLASKKRAK